MSVSLTSKLICFSLVIMMCFACVRKQTNQNETISVHLSANPESLHPYYHISRPSIHIAKYIFQPLLDIDYYTGQLVPIIAKSRPKISKGINGKSAYSFYIRPEAKWDDGSPITAEDVLFSLKIMKLPGEMKNTDRDFFFDSFDGFILDIKDSRHFTITSQQHYVQVENAFCNLLILPKHIYDPEAKISNITIDQLVHQKLDTRERQFIEQFLKEFSRPAAHTDNRLLLGSGAYKLEDWTKDKCIKISKKENWWGDKISANMFFDNKAKHIKYIINKNKDKALSELMLGNIDVMSGINQQDLKNLIKSDVFKSSFILNTPTRLSFTYLGLNWNNKILKDLAVRRSIAHAISKSNIINNVLGGYGQTITSSIHPNNPSYNKEIIDYAFDLTKANQLLESAGWKDDDNDGYREKLIKGEPTALKLKLNFVKDYSARKIAEYIQEALKSVGIKVSLHELKFDTYMSLSKAHDFDMLLGNFVTAQSLADPKQLWHSNSYNKGSNWVGFSNFKADQLITLIRQESDLEKRIEYENLLQRIIHEDLPFVFLFAPQHRILLSKQIKNISVSSSGLGFRESNFVKQ